MSLSYREVLWALERLSIRRHNDYAVNARIHGRKIALKYLGSDDSDSIQVSKEQERAIEKAIKEKFNNG